MKTRPAMPLADQLAALADSVRLRLMRLLEAGELSVGEIGRVLQVPQSTASRHLKALADAGWVGRRNEGPATYYRLVLDDLPANLRAVWIAARDTAATAAQIGEDRLRLEAVLADRRTDSESFFGRVGGEWDPMRRQLFGDRFTPAALMGFMPRGWVVADLGCGTGDAAELLAPVVKRVIAVDQNEAMLSAARERLAGVKAVEFVRADLDKLPMRAGTLDAAVMVLVLHHIAEPVSVLSEAARCLKTPSKGGEGGLMVIDMVAHGRDEYRQTMGHKHLGFSEAALRRLMKEAGFQTTEYRDLPREPQAKGPGLFAAIGRL